MTFNRKRATACGNNQLIRLANLDGHSTGRPETERCAMAPSQQLAYGLKQCGLHYV